jgi:hypothetical protein
MKKTYEGKNAFRPVAAIVEILYTSTWVLSHPMMFTLEAMIFDLTNKIIPNLRKEKYSLKADVQAHSMKLDVYMKAYEKKESTETTSRLLCEIFHCVPLFSSISRQRFIHKTNERVNAEHRLNIAKMLSEDILQELSDTEELIIDLNTLLKVMLNLFTKGVEADLMKDYEA